MMKAIIPGSFDPFTVGHLALLKKATEMFDSVTVLLCVNFDKKTLFTFEERLELLQASVEGLPNVTVDSHVGWLYDYLKNENDVVLFKGVRTVADFEYEREMADFNREHSGVDTVFYIAEKDMVDVSSTTVRQCLSDGGEWESFIPQNAQKLVKKFYKNI